MNEADLPSEEEVERRNDEDYALHLHELNQKEQDMTKDINHYENLRQINVNEYTEKKGNLTYLSWAWAVDRLLMEDPMATWEYKEPAIFNETMMVFCTVTAFGKSMTAQLPVMDYKNKAIVNPDAFAVNTAMQRALAKAIALHGLGLYIYNGEDLPPADPIPESDITPILNAISQATTLPDLQRIYTDAIEMVGENKALKSQINQATTARKNTISKGE